MRSSLARRVRGILRAVDPHRLTLLGRLGGLHGLCGLRRLGRLRRLRPRIGGGRRGGRLGRGHLGPWLGGRLVGRPLLLRLLLHLLLPCLLTGLPTLFLELLLSGLLLGLLLCLTTLLLGLLPGLLLGLATLLLQPRLLRGLGVRVSLGGALLRLTLGLPPLTPLLLHLRRVLGALGAAPVLGLRLGCVGIAGTLAALGATRRGHCRIAALLTALPGGIRLRIRVLPTLAPLLLFRRHALRIDRAPALLLRLLIVNRLLTAAPGGFLGTVLGRRLRIPALPPIPAFLGPGLAPGRARPADGGLRPTLPCLAVLPR